MKYQKTLSLTIVMMLCFLFSHCYDEHAAGPCGSSAGTEFVNRTGRIYRWTNSTPSFYYIGNVQQATTGVNGGYIACNEIPDRLQVVGTVVVYSGIDKGAAPDTGDPLFAFIELTNIRAVE